ncbi:ATP-binding protein [Amycolatopsis sp. OK19-0408]|uniref:ATP-binding protein n=1 Tax=Amycolatopsis iheyensis TaxID=2945988 RepID=A0A9X2NAS6_9PSEU|nr:ATP-binding protein [Amycolatopsis iheyensis]MCR6483798.1 ATP-binding protein [Amycolatopsis iheyensis]
MSTAAGRVHLDPSHRATATTALVTGVLDLDSYPELRDGLLKIAAEAPDGLIADIDGLTIRDPALVTLFSLVAMRIGDWPGIPFTVVTGRPEHRTIFSERTVDRFVPVHADHETAEHRLLRPTRRRAAQLLARSANSSALARDFVRRICGEWGAAVLTDDALLVVTELVENAIRHTASAPRVRLELRRHILSIAVGDDDPHPAVLRERLGALEPGLGLRMVAQVAKVWGSTPSWSGGKVVWAVLTRRAAPGRGRDGG